MLHTFVRLADRVWRWARGEYEKRLTGTLASLPADMLADAARQVMRFTMPLPDTPVDALPYLLRSFGLPTYDESYWDTLDRLRDASETHAVAGAQAMLEREAVRCGLENPTISLPTMLHPGETPSYWIVADGIGEIAVYGEFTYGDFIWGYQFGQSRNIRAMTKYFKPARERFLGVRPYD